MSSIDKYIKKVEEAKTEEAEDEEKKPVLQFLQGRDRLSIENHIRRRTKISSIFNKRPIPVEKDRSLKERGCHWTISSLP